uniref:Uncharacterized protein n=1 Tax=Triticum urartu TaxID=4572 RepID=A0A8R7TTF9_TRIUA
MGLGAGGGDMVGAGVSGAKAGRGGLCVARGGEGRCRRPAGATGTGPAANGGDEGRGRHWRPTGAMG